MRWPRRGAPRPPAAVQEATAREATAREATAREATAREATAAPPPGAALTIDALGRKCPVPIIMLAERIREVAVGQTVEVLADDPAARTDLPAWCNLKSQEFLVTRDLAAGWGFLVRRSY